MAVYKTKLNGKRVSWRYEFAIGPRTARQQFRQGGYATEREAKDAEAAKRTEIKRAVAIKAKGTLGDALERFFEDRSAGLSPITAYRYRDMVPSLHPDLLAMPIADVRPLHLHEEWTRLLREGGRKPGPKGATVDTSVRPLSSKTVRNIAGMVSAACAWGVLYGIIQTNPVTASKPPSAKGRRGIALSPDQTRLLIDSATGWLAAFMETCSGLGIRRGEALALRWSDIREGYAHVSRSLGQAGKAVYFKGTKMNNVRAVEIPASVAAALEAQRVNQAPNRAAFPDYDAAADLIFAQPNGTPMIPAGVSRDVSRAMKRCKLPKGASLHTLRHTHGSQLIDGGANPADVAARLGHDDAGTTLRIYTHPVPGRGKLAEAWEKQQKGKVN